MLPPHYIFLPVIVQVVLTIVVYFALAAAKKKAYLAGGVDLKRAALHDDAWPDSVAKINNNIRNQFESPLLFYVLVVVLYLLGNTGIAAQVLAWSFVALRVVHAYVHLGSNFVPLRRRMFIFSVVILFLMTLLAAWSVFTH